MDTRRWLRTRTTAMVVTTLLALAPTAGVLTAQDSAPALPSAREVLDRFIEAIGGADAIRAQDNRTVSGRLEMPAQGISGSMTILQQAPDKQFASIEIEGIGNIRTGYDGTVAWTIHPATGPMVLEGKMLEQTRFQGDFYAALYEEGRYSEMETVAETEFNDVTCYRLRMVTPYGEEQMQYFDVVTGLMVGWEASQESIAGPIAVTSKINEYKEFNGIKTAAHITQSFGPGLEQQMFVTEVSTAPIEPAKFALPVEIQVLLEDEPAQVVEEP